MPARPPIRISPSSSQNSKKITEMEIDITKDMNVSLSFPGYMPISPDKEHL